LYEFESSKVAEVKEGAKPTASAPRSRPGVERIGSNPEGFVDDRVKRLLELFPEASSEGKLDIDRLREVLSDVRKNGPDRYSFSWAGKRDAIRLLQLPSRGTLNPKMDASIDFADSQNAFIEGDNLEVLKILYKSYFGHVKLVYIDPPYNTGNDLVYTDDYADPLDRYLRLTGQVDTAGNLLISNPETSGRYHSAWLSMMYPRLFLARQLLRDDGVIFVSIDDHEVSNLRLAMNELFGEENFLGCIVRATGTTTGQDSRGLGSSFDYLLCYSKTTGYEMGGLPLSEADAARFNLEDRRGKYSLLQLRKTGNNDRREDRPFLYYPVTAPDGAPVLPMGPSGYESCWRCGPSTYEKMVADDLIVWKQVPKDGTEHWSPYVKYYLEGREKRPSPLWTDLDGNKKATIEVKELLGDKVFSNPKPTALMTRILEIATEPDTGDIVLDFFAGSATTGHAVLGLNRKDNGNRRFICVQLPEPTPDDSTARRAGFASIAAIGEERLRKVVERLRSQMKQLKIDSHSSKEDLGFRSFTLAPSNFKPWIGVEDREADSYAEQMAWFADPLVSEWNPESLLWELTLKEGYPLGTKVEQRKDVRTNVVWNVADPTTGQSFLVCLDDELKGQTVHTLLLERDDLFVCRDLALNDELAANLALQCRLKTV
jgi:adenine-specific DNA-methyltransferase